MLAILHTNYYLCSMSTNVLYTECLILGNFLIKMNDGSSSGKVQTTSKQQS
jgi:hypothetical protein